MEEFDKEFNVVTEVEFGHQHFTQLPTPDKFKSFLSTSIHHAEEEMVKKMVEVVNQPIKFHSSTSDADKEQITRLIYNERQRIKALLPYLINS